MEVIIKYIALASAIYLFLKAFIPVIQSLLAEGIAGLIVLIVIIWWLTQKSK